MDRPEAARLAEELARRAQVVGVEVEEKTSRRLVSFAEMVWEGQRRVRLTGAASLEELVVKHLVDCLTLGRLKEIRWDRWIDVGSGGGLPGLVVALAHETGRGDLLEATGKKADFLREAVDGLGLRGHIGVVQDRAEVWGQAGGREAYRVAVARAVAPARVLAEYLVPLLEVGGRAVLMKGPGVDDELREAGRALEVLGAAVERVEAFSLPEGTGERRLVLLRKLRPSPRAYPRRPGVPTRRPL